MPSHIIYYFPLLAVPIVLLLYFSGPLSAAGLTIFASLIGTVAIIFSAEGFFSGTSIGEKAAPIIFILQTVWLWVVFWVSEKLIEQRDMEKHHLQEESENLEMSMLDYQREQKELEKFSTSMEERISRYSLLRAFTDDLAGIVKIRDVQRQTEESVRKIFAGDPEIRAHMDLLSFPNTPLKEDALSEWVVRHRIPRLVFRVAVVPHPL